MRILDSADGDVNAPSLLPPFPPGYLSQLITGLPTDSPSAPPLDPGPDPGDIERQGCTFSGAEVTNENPA